MRLLLLACLATATVAGSAAAHTPDTDPHVLPLFLMPGTQMKQTFVYTKSVDTNGKIESSATTTEYLNQVEPTLTGFTVTKHMTHFEATPGTAGSPAGAAGKLSALIARMSSLDNVIFDADSSLTPLVITNWDQVKADAGAEVKTALGKDDPKMVDSVFGLFDAQAAAGAFLRGDNLMSMPHNIGLVLNQPLVQVAEAPSPVGGTLLYDISLTLTRWDEAAGEAEVVYDNRPQAESLQELMTAFGPRLLAASGVDTTGRDATAMFRQMKLEKSTHCVYTVDIGTSLVKHGDCTVIGGVSLPGQSQITTETYAMTEGLAE